MSRKMSISRWIIALTAVISMFAMAALPLGVGSAETPTLTVVASELNNPRGMAFGPEGALYVAEAGKGGTGQCMPTPEGPKCFGTSGSITRIWRGEQTRFVTGLPSIAAEDGSSALGPHDIYFQGRGGGYVAIGLGANPDVRDQFGEDGALFGHLIKVAASGEWKSVADISGYEKTANPDGGMVDSNPYSVLALPSKQYVADAGGNDLLQVDANGTISTITTFPTRTVSVSPTLSVTMQSVPDAITLGPDGNIYVGELTGFPFPSGAAKVYKVVPGSPPEVYADNLTNVIDIDFDKAGNLYVLEIAANGLTSGDMSGALIRIAPDGTRETIVSEGLVAPTGLVIGPDDAIYIANKGVFPEQGEVLRLDEGAPAGPVYSAATFAQVLLGQVVFAPLIQAH